MRFKELISETPLPADWDRSQFVSANTTFKSRLAYAVDRAKKIGAGSSRVAMTIEYENRPTVLKVAKNKKGLAQNKAEIDILSDGYARQMSILIPLIDYDKENNPPVWLQTELAQKVSEKTLCNLLGIGSLRGLVSLANYIAMPDKQGRMAYDRIFDNLQQSGKTEKEIDNIIDYANNLAELQQSFNIELSDLSRAANWGLYRNTPAIIDVGFSSDVRKDHYSGK